MANNSAVTIGAQTGWHSAIALKGGPLSLNSLIPPTLSNADTLQIALNAADPVTYTNARLSNMTTNDMIYALRYVYDPGNI